ncbi:MAG: mechanosensitive ion channel family protein [Myxococcaceae bacterium]|nr:mechanosensitive ion channel family protein [Myxococcaceae bacterium]
MRATYANGRCALMSFLQGNTALVIGVVLLTLVAIGRALAKEQQLKADLRGALMFLAGWLALRGLGFVLEQINFHGVDKAIRVAWMLSFAFGCVRAFVAVALFGYRRLNVGETPKILRDLLDFVLYVIAAVPILKTQLDVDLTGLLATSAILSVVLGLALQETLGNFFAGLSLQLERPYRAGDWISVGENGEHVGRVVQIAWRATRIVTPRLEETTVPNSVIAKQPLKNFPRGGLPVGIDFEIGIAYAVPPNTVRTEVLAALGEISSVLKSPAPFCRVKEFGESAVIYTIRFFVMDFNDWPSAQDEAYTRLWYRFSRANIEIPYPQRVVHNRTVDTSSEQTHLALLSRLDLFQPFSTEEKADLARAAGERRFGKGEALIREGEQGDTFYVIVSGEVAVARGGTEVARLARGAYLGEMSLLTGDARSATVVATTDVMVLELDRDAFARHFAAHPERAGQMSELLAQRRAQLEAVAAASGAPAPEGTKANEILRRLRSIFRLQH